MSFQPINPKPYLASLVGLKVVVRLKFSGTEYHGTLVSVDNYMNLLLDKDVIEVEQKIGEDPDLANGTKLESELFVRCNNVLWIGKQPESEPEIVST
jgi:small nuclear ribonucleoprotein F